MGEGRQVADLREEIYSVTFLEPGFHQGGVHFHGICWLSGSGWFWFVFSKPLGMLCHPA